MNSTEKYLSNLGKTISNGFNKMFDDALARQQLGYDPKTAEPMDAAYIYKYTRRPAIEATRDEIKRLYEVREKNFVERGMKCD